MDGGLHGRRYKGPTIFIDKHPIINGPVLFKPVLFKDQHYSKLYSSCDGEGTCAHHVPDQLVGAWKALSKQGKTGAPGRSGTQSGWHMPGMVCVWRKGFVAEVFLSPGVL